MCCFSKAYDPRARPALGVDHDVDTATIHSKRDLAFLTIGNTIIQRRVRGLPLELQSLRKIQTMLLEVGEALGPVPLKFHD